MPTPLLATKLYIPPPRPDRVPRPRLIARLDEGLRLGRKLTLISAPAGFGKTTLLSEWIEEGVGSKEYGVEEEHEPSGEGSPTSYSLLPTPIFAWLSLDEGDNDPARFLTYLVAALRRVEESIGDDILDALRSPQPPPLEPLLASLINQVDAALAPDDLLLLILDDYHLITARQIHDALAYVLDHLPGNVHLAIATRADPPLPLARLRGRGQLTELRQADLRFTPGEAAAFLKRVSGLDLTAGDVSALEERTEGWITGLQLAALSMQNRDDVAGFIRAFTGSHRYVLDYLTEEVLRRQPQEIQAFLMRTSILDRLSGPLCDALVPIGESAIGNQRLQRVSESAIWPEDDLQICRFADSQTGGLAAFSSQRILQYLEHNNLFVVPLDDRREWYRYHRLFADLLRARLEATAPDQVVELHRRASAWYEQAGPVDDAVKHAVAGGDLARAADVVAGHGRALLLRGELFTLLRWIGALPEEMVLSSAPICVYHAWALLLTGQLDAVEPRLRQAERVLKTPSDDDLLGDVATIRAYRAALQGDVERTIELARLALERLTPAKQRVRGVVFFALGGAHMVQGDIAAAGEAMAQAGEIGLQEGNLHIAIPALNALAGIKLLQGDLHRAQATAQEAVRLATDAAGHLLPIAAGPLSALAELAYEWNDLEGAMAYARQSVELGQRWGNKDTLVSNTLTLAQVLIGRGELDEARDALQEAERVGREFALGRLIPARMQAARALLWLAQGDLTAAAQWAEGAPAARPGPLDAGEALVIARVRLALGQPGAPLEVLAPVIEMAHAHDLTTWVIEGLALQALAHHAQGDEARALAALGEALIRARPEGYRRRFLDLGPAMAALLGKGAVQDVAPDYVRELRSAFGISSGIPPGSPYGTPEAGPPPHPPVQPLIEPLSAREREVLSLVAEGLSNREVGRRLHIAESTVKSHLNNVYGKLGVKNRTQAATKARALNLLRSPR